MVTYDSGGEYLGGDDVAGYRMAEGPAEGVQVDGDDADDAAGGSGSVAADVAFGHAGGAEADIKG